MAKDKDTKKVVNVWSKFLNPLRTLNNIEIERLFEQSKLGQDTRLQVCYFEIERNTPIFSVCINKRTSGVLGRNWDITPTDESEQAKYQAEQIKKMFDRSDSMNEDGLTEAIKHLVLSTFRGRAAVKPFIDSEGNLIFKRLQNWNFVSFNGKNYWNPNAEFAYFTNGELPAGVVEIPKDEVCYIVDDKPLDWCGLTIYLRQLIGEEAWARATEKFGIPQVLITTPEGTPETDFEKWNYRAQSIYEGGSGVLPYGSEIKTLTDARGQDPFSAYIDHQMEQFCILATGGTLNTLGGSTGLGSNLADVQNQQFNTLVNMDCKRIQNTMNSCAVKKCIRHLFGENAPVLCKFEFTEQDDVTPDQYIDMAVKLNQIGIKIDAAKLRELTKLDMIDINSWSPEYKNTGWTEKDIQEEKREIEGE